MATIKSFTSLEQSKVLSEILPIESADMCLTFVNNIWNPVCGKAEDIYQLQKNCYEPDYTKDEYIDFEEFEPKVVPCWSLAALLDVLPHIQEFYPTVAKINDKYVCRYAGSGIWTNGDNSIDACVEMIIKLHELKML